MTAKVNLGGFLVRFTLLHVLTYVAMGLIFMQLSNYSQHFASGELSAIMRPIDDPRLALAIPMQIPRGLILGLALFPFREVFVRSRWGWLKLAFLMYVLMGLGAVITGPGSIEGFLYTRLGFGNPLIGLPEIASQILAFAGLLTLWERRVEQGTAPSLPQMVEIPKLDR